MSSYATYEKLLRDMGSHRLPGERRPRIAIIGIGWDSAFSGFRKLMNDIIPFPALSSLLSAIPDLMLFPLSFWSKAATADRIGFGGLRTALNDVFEYAYPNGEGTPDIFLAGHSFGTRIVSELMQDELVFFPVNAEPFVAKGNVRGAMLMQPAMAGPGLHLDADYPLLVTQSEYDHAVGGLFPVANVIINTATFTSFEALFRYQFFDAAGAVAQSGARAGMSAVDRAETAVGSEESVPGTMAKTAAWVSGRSAYLILRGTAEVLSLPVALAAGIATTPFNYLYVQGIGLYNHPGDHVMDTLAQLPGVEIFVGWIGNLAGRELAWGRRGKGFLNFGALNESIGRLYTPPPLAKIPSEIYSPQDIEAARGQGGCGLPKCSGVMLVDSSEIIRVGSFGEDLGQPKFDYTLGWVDPLGAHTDYRNESVVRMMAGFFDTAAENARSKELSNPVESAK